MKEIPMVQWLGYTARTSVTMEIQDMKMGASFSTHGWPYDDRGSLL